VSIQHGIDWDLPVSELRTLRWVMPNFRKRREQDRRIRRVVQYFENCRNKVCVDYNFQNWYRATTGKQVEGNVWVIPNCGTPVAPDEVRRPDGDVRVLFARRFEPYRGTRLMATAIESVLTRHPGVLVTFAGEGPDEGYLRNRFGGCSRVRFTKYAPHEAMKIHVAHDIAVIPSLGSEGTTLAAAEAMGAGCVVIASAVGGLTNMILDGYNGVLIRPRSDDLADAIVRLSQDVPLRMRMAARAYEAATACFSVAAWRAKWTTVLQAVGSES